MTKLTRRLGVVLAVAATAIVATPRHAVALPPGSPKIGMICTNGPTFHLTTNSGYAETPDGNSILMWGYANVDTGSAFQSPGPVLCVNQGDTVTVTLHNTLPEPASIVFPGQEGVTATGASGLLTAEAPTGGDASYSFVASQPGTYIYESGSDMSKQVEMGLYGALVVRPIGHANWAYGSDTHFNPAREYLVLLAEIDPDLHHAVEVGGTYDFTALHNHYFTINGRSFPDTVQDNGVSWLPNQPYGALIRVQPYDATLNPEPAMIRMLNVGMLNHPFHPHGNHIREIAQDGRRMLSPGGSDASSEHFGDTIGAGQTQDFLFVWTDQDSWNSVSNPFPASVANPNFNNLTFKDNNTWFSGSPYLGKKGTLPATVVSQNLCGEWYFPWHSHALNEFSNFDEGFGGMGDLLRVDPLGGCTAYPASTTITTGTLNGGTYTALGATDSLYYKVNSTTTGTRTSDWYAGYTGVPLGSTNFTVKYVGRNCTTPSCAAGVTVPTTLWIWKWATSSWVQLGAATNVGGLADTTITRVPPSPMSDYIGTGGNQGKVRVRVQSVGSATNFITQGNLQLITYDAP
jgi:Multicopper oxidase